MAKAFKISKYHPVTYYPVDLADIQICISQNHRGNFFPCGDPHPAEDGATGCAWGLGGLLKDEESFSC